MDQNEQAAINAVIIPSMFQPKPPVKRRMLPKQDPVGPIELGKPLPMAPDYGARVKCMDFWSASYEGGPWYKRSRDAEDKDVLVAVPGEEGQSLELRRQLATYKNYCKPIVNRYMGLVYGSGKVERESENERFKEFLDDCDRLGNTLHEYVRQAQTMACIEGVHYAIIDSDKEAPDATVRETSMSNTGMFLVDLDPRKVIDYCHVGHKLVQALVMTGDGTARLYSQVDYVDVWLDKNAKVDYVSPPTPHGYGDIPVIQFLASDHGDSMLADIAELNKAIFNIDSLHRTELQRQTFTTHFILGCEARDITTLVSGGRRFVAIPNANPITVETVGADISQADSLRQAMAADISEIWRLAGLSNPEVVQNTESGRALRIRFDEISAQAKALADQGEKSECMVTGLWRVGMADENVVDPQYPENFAAEDVVVDIDILGKLPNEPETLKKLMISRVASELFPSMDEADADKLALEIKALKFEDPIEAAEEKAGFKPEPKKKETSR
jgi:hypothetical protein